jgi:hypothetical protein
MVNTCCPQERGFDSGMSLDESPLRRVNLPRMAIHNAPNPNTSHDVSAFGGGQSEVRPPGDLSNSPSPARARNIAARIPAATRSPGRTGFDQSDSLIALTI